MKENKRYFYIVIIVILLLVVGGFVYFTLIKDNYKKLNFSRDYPSNSESVSIKYIINTSYGKVYFIT